MTPNASELTPVDRALEHLLAQMQVTDIGEEVPLNAALGRVLAEDQHAHINVPEYDNSAMDGYALASGDIAVPGARLPVSGTVAAGQVGEPLAPGTAARIFTGAPLPDGADAVVAQESTDRDGDAVVIREPPAPGQNVRRLGHDIKNGDKVLLAGHRMRPQDLGLLASLGIARVKILRPLRVAIVNTGDEIVPPTDTIRPGQIYDSNSYTLAGLIEKLGMETLHCGIVADNPESTQRALADAAQKSDCIITSGGVSVGDADHVKAAVERLGELSLWRLAIKPGKPFSFGSVSGIPFFGLPGNPVAVFVTFVILVRPCLLTMQGARETDVPVFPVQAGFALEKPGIRREYRRVRLVHDRGGEPALEAFPDQGSSVLSSVAWATGLAVIPENTTVATGDLLDYLPFTGLL